jgi:hypothetical protein
VAVLEKTQSLNNTELITPISRGPDSNNKQGVLFKNKAFGVNNAEKNQIITRRIFLDEESSSHA